MCENLNVLFLPKNTVKGDIFVELEGIYSVNAVISLPCIIKFALDN
jgi:hypothetical protein